MLHMAVKNYLVPLSGEVVTLMLSNVAMDRISHSSDWLLANENGNPFFSILSIESNWDCRIVSRNYNRYATGYRPAV